MPATTYSPPNIVHPENVDLGSKPRGNSAISFATPALFLNEGSRTSSSFSPPGTVLSQPFGLVHSTTTQAFSSFGSEKCKTFRFFGSASLDPFRFLDLPRDIRLLCYDNLLTRTHTDIALCIPGAPPHAKITLIEPDPIAPIHMACKMLSEEVAPFLKARILRMFAPWRAPRLIVHAGPIITLLREGGVLDQVLSRISGFRDGVNVPMHEYVQQQLPADMLLRGQMMHDLMVYTKRAGLLLKSVDTEMDWTENATNRDRSMDALGRGVDYCIAPNQLVRSWSDEPGDGLFRIAVVFGHHEPVGFNMRVFFDKLSFMCDIKEVNTLFWTYGWGSEAHNFSADDEFLHFEGEMSKKMWDEEWA